MKRYYRANSMNRYSYQMNYKNKGLTLIELMLVIALISILTAIGYPIYTDYLAKARRADAQGALYAFANSMEQYASRQPNLGYASAASGDDENNGPPKAEIFPDEAPIDGVTKLYDLSLNVTVDAGGYGGFYTLSASPKDIQEDDECGVLSLTSAGTRSVSTEEAGCWR